MCLSAASRQVHRTISSPIPGFGGVCRRMLGPSLTEPSRVVVSLGLFLGYIRTELSSLIISVKCESDNLRGNEMPSLGNIQK